MKLILLVIIFFLLTANLPACQTTPIPDPEEEHQPPTTQAAEPVVDFGTPPPTETLITPSPPKEKTSIPSPEQPLVVEHEHVRPRYDWHAKFNYYQRHLHISGSVEYVNNSDQDLYELLFIVDPNRYWNAFRLNALNWEEEISIETYTLERDRLQITLPEILTRGDRILVYFDYDIFLPAIPPPSDTVRPMIFGYTERQVNLVDWHPYIPPLNPEGGWLANNPWFFGEHQVYEKADFYVEIETINPPADLVLAASSIPLQEENSYIYSHQNARNFVFSASHMYQVFSKKVGSTIINSYAFPFDSVGGKVALEETASSFAFFNEIFGDYPHESLSVVEADFLDGMEYDGLFFLSRGFFASYDGTPKGFLTLIAVHETAHQWWYGIVANDQALEPWLDEALCTYSELLYFEVHYPDLVDWWWYFRIHFHEPTGMIDKAIYDYPSYLSFRNSVYLRGAVFLDELRKRIGDDAFFAFITDYVESFRDQIATGDDFFSILENYTDENLTDLKAQFFITHQ
jgi:hypothetical protein